MSESSRDEERERALDEACKARRIRGDDRFLVAALLERPRASWPGCCGSGCDTCMLDVVEAAEEVAAKLGD